MNKKRARSGTFSRLLKILIKSYPVLIPIVIFCILFSAAAATIPATLIQKITAIIEDSLDWAAAFKEIKPRVTNFITCHIFHKKNTSYTNNCTRRND